MITIMNIVRESKVQKIDGSKVWKTLLNHRWDIEILKTNSCLNDGQLFEVIYKVGQDLNLINGSNLWSWIHDEDLSFGIELFSALHYCPEKLIEAAKLSKLFESLITNHSLNTVVAAQHPTKGWRQHQGLHCNQHVVPEAGQEVQLLPCKEHSSFDDNRQPDQTHSS